MQWRSDISRLLRRSDSIHGEFAVEMPVHLLRALWVRECWGIPVDEPPKAIGLNHRASRPDLAEPWQRWWDWLVELDVTDDRLRDTPAALAKGSQCPPEIHALLTDHAEDIARWTTSWRTRFRDEIVPLGTTVERRLASSLDTRGSDRPLLVRVLPLESRWAAWSGPQTLLVSQVLREDEAGYERTVRVLERPGD